MKFKNHILYFLLFCALNLILINFFIEFNMVKADGKETICFLSEEDSAYPTRSVNEIKIETITVDSDTIRLLLKDENKIVKINIEEYLCGVLTGEMYSNVPQEALKAVAVAARTYTLYTAQSNKNKDYDIVADSSVAQAYISKAEAVEAWGEQGEIKYNQMKKAIQDTCGEVLTYDGELICALYHASSYPSTEDCENVFIQNLPYLKSVEGIESLDNAYSSCVSFTESELNKVLEKNSLPKVNLKTLNVIINKNKNNRCENVYLFDDNVGFYIDGRKIRNVFNINSTSFNVEIADEKLMFRVYGYGHGVGLSQNGAKIMAEAGKNYTDILYAYYSGTKIFKTIYK